MTRDTKFATLHEHKAGMQQPDTLDPDPQTGQTNLGYALLRKPDERADDDADQARWVEGDEIGRGGNGRIYGSYDRLMRRHSAVKTLLSGDDEHGYVAQAFVEEAQITGRLEHPNIVPIHELGRNEDGQLYFSMKWVVGKTFRHAIYDQHDVGADKSRLYTLLEIYVKVCDALAYAHAQGVMHCDLKPSNIMVGDFGQVFLMDWGLAKEFDPTAPLSSDPPAEEDVGLAGTPQFMSPEQASGIRDGLDIRSDIFSMGTVLFELLTGKTPFKGRNPFKIADLVRETVVTPPSEFGSDYWVPGALERIVLKAMQPNRNDRYQSVSELKAAIVRFIRGEGEFQTVDVKKGNRIINQGDVGDAAYVIVEGKCGVYVWSPGESEEVLVRTMGDGEVFGETAILAATTRSASVVALEDTRLVLINSTVLEHHMESIVPWMAMFIKTLASRFNDDSRRLDEFRKPVRIANVAKFTFMYLCTWGEVGASGVEVPLTDLTDALYTIAGCRDDGVYDVLTRIEAIEVSASTVTCHDMKAFRAQWSPDGPKSPEP